MSEKHCFDVIDGTLQVLCHMAEQPFAFLSHCHMTLCWYWHNFLACCVNTLGPFIFFNCWVVVFCILQEGERIEAIQMVFVPGWLSWAEQEYVYKERLDLSTFLNLAPVSYYSFWLILVKAKVMIPYVSLSDYFFPSGQVCWRITWVEVKGQPSAGTGHVRTASFMIPNVREIWNIKRA